MMTKRQINKVVRYFLKHEYTCPHSIAFDCTRCTARWIREGIAKAELSENRRIINAAERAARNKKVKRMTDQELYDSIMDTEGAARKAGR